MDSTQSPSRADTRPRTRRIRIAWLGVLLASIALAVLVWALRPRPIEVDSSEVTLGRFEGVIEEEGRTRVRERFTLSAPFAARLERPTVRAGDRVRAGDPLARLWPLDAVPLDWRTRAGLSERADAAQAALERAEAELARSASTLEQARVEHARATRLAEQGFLSPAALEQARLVLAERESARTAARHAREVARHELGAAQAALLPARTRASTEDAQAREALRQSGGAWLLRAPTEGFVLRVMQESEAVLSAGTGVLEIGDTRALEAVIELLTQEAMALRPGMSVRLTLGAAETIEGRIARVEPAARTKVSALGVDEQRVAVIAAFDLPEGAAPPGDGWRVDASIVTLVRDAVPLIPVGALIRVGAGWEVFVVEAGRAQARAIKLGARNARVAWVAGGLQTGERVVVHPPDTLLDGGRVRIRPPGARASVPL